MGATGTARAGPNTKIIPGHGPTVDRTADLDARIQQPGPTTERFIRQVYAELKAAR